MATAKRPSYAPQVPTLKELGVNVESNSWNGLLAPADTPGAIIAAIIATMNAEVSKALNAPAVLEAFQKGGIHRYKAAQHRLATLFKAKLDAMVT
jgi:tripartite-type tricarboxylate transporter receptor subunit TctC